MTAMEWIYALEAIQELPQEDRIILVSFAVQVDRDSVGFSSNYFTITYGLLGSVVENKDKILYNENYYY